MIARIVRKMLNNRWMVSCLLIGFILAAAMMSSVPIYTGGALQRMLTKDLESFQSTSGYFPGTYSVRKTFNNMVRSDIQKYYNYMDKKITQDMFVQLNLPAATKSRTLTNDFLKLKADLNADPDDTLNFKMEALEGLQDHITITHGRIYDKNVKDGVYEVIITAEGMKKLDMVLDKEYFVTDLLDEKLPPIKIKAVGVFTLKDQRDPYWYEGGIGRFSTSTLMDFDLYKKSFSEDQTINVRQIRWYTALDYHKLEVSNLDNLVTSLKAQGKWFKENDDVDFKVPVQPIFEKYTERAKMLKLTLWVLQVPILLMLVFYLFMVSQLIIEQEKNEIAVLKSRGASRGQIFNGYFMQSIILSCIALIVGPLLGLFLCEVLGASNGFMEFVQRTSLPVALSGRAYLYAFYAVGAFIVTMLLPVLPATKTSIVQFKQKKAGSRDVRLWQKYFLDILLFAVSCYGIYNYRTRLVTLQLTGADSAEVPIDPLLFVISTMFILSLGLIFLRLYPYIVRFIFHIGRKMWSPTLYASLINVGRSGGKDQFLMLFLILTISIGIFNANTARTINTNTEEKVKYSIGADMTLLGRWYSNQPSGGSSGPGGPGGGSDAPKGPVLYEEPHFDQFQKIDGIEMATKVFIRNDAIYSAGDRSGNNGYFMGIVPNEFGKVAWFRPNLLGAHWYHYLNLLAKDPRAMLVSRSFEKKFNVKKGDTINIRWGDNNYFSGIIFGFVDYWPTYNPHFRKTGFTEAPDLVVANLSYVHARMPMEPYQVWMKKKDNATSEQVYNDIKKKKIDVVQMEDTDQEVILKKNDPLLQGTNGALTLGFIVTMVISTIGFLIYWILSIKSRVLQFGIFRAMGVSLKEIIEMLFCEQVLISGTSIIMGILVGGITSDLFVPLLQIVYSSADQVPPFKVAAYGGDYIKLYIIIALMLTLGFFILGRMISRININQAIKLGED